MISEEASADKKHVVVGQDDGSSSPISISFKVNLAGNSFSHKYKVSCAFKSMWANVV